MGLRLSWSIGFILAAGLAFAPPATASTEMAAAAPAMAIYVTGRGATTPQARAEGFADPDRRIALTAETPLRIASNTKTFVAATVLRLWEQDRLELDAPIRGLIDPELDDILRRDGYDTGLITVRHLLSHSAGLYDHGGDPRYIKAVLAEPERRWTRADQVRLTTDYADPLSLPGTEFRYSDTGYVLLGDIIERLTRKPLALAVREALKLDRLGLKATWWEAAEPAPAGAAQRARQWLDAGTEGTRIDPSMDLYGGGGLVMSPRDLATFFAALFEGRVFERSGTLKEMLRPGSHRGADQYRLGIFVKQVGGEDVYWHSGFWGTVAYYSPRRGIAAAGATTDRRAFETLRRRVEAEVGIVPASR